MYFPSICVDNFFNNPKEIREFASTLDFYDTSVIGGTWPGKRTKPLHIISPNYFELFTRKVLSLIFPVRLNGNPAFICDTAFHLIEPYDGNGIESGWVHTDENSFLAGLVYLNESIDSNCGTTIFRPKEIANRPINHEYKNAMFTNTNLNKELLNDKRKENNEQFEETIIYKNIFNRLIAYDATNYHTQSNLEFFGSEPRLTQVFFFRQINSNYFPIPESKTIQL